MLELLTACYLQLEGNQGKKIQEVFLEEALFE